VTDYAGTSEHVQTYDILGSEWDQTAFIGVDPIQAIDLIAMQYLNTHPLIQPLLMQFIPPPDGLDPQDFWNNIEQYADLIDLAAWDSVAFADALAERIIEPAMHALDLLETWPYITRLHTTISPQEMTVDPIFMPVPDLDDVSQNLVVSGLDVCGELGSIYEVPWSGATKKVCLGESDGWPQLFRQHPALRVEQLAPMGPPQVEEDLSQVILADWMAHQAPQDCGDPGFGGSGDGDGDSGDGGQSSEESGDAGIADDAAQASCACSTDGRRASGIPLGLAFGLFGFAFLRFGIMRT
jgi:hypothetical protein